MKKFIPYSYQTIDSDDINAVVKVLKSNWLTTGPKVEEFEKQFADYVGSKYAVSVSSGTAALHAIFHSINIEPGDEVIVPAITFVATANAIIYNKGIPVFVDIHSDSMLLNPHLLREKITKKTKAIIAVDYAGQPCDYDELKRIADEYDLKLVTDACHSLGSEYHGKKTGSISDLTAFSFHPLKNITTGEGGMITTNDVNYYKKLLRFRNHGINKDHRNRSQSNTWVYDMVELGYNYRLSDIQCALGSSQLKKINSFVQKRNAIANLYNDLLSKEKGFTSLSSSSNVLNAYHLYVLKVQSQDDSIRSDLFEYLRSCQIGVNVHYLPVYRHSYYQNRYQENVHCPVAEQVYNQILSLPIYPSLEDKDVEYVVEKILAYCEKSPIK